MTETEGARPPVDEDDSATVPFRMGGVARHAIIYGLGTMASKALSFIMLPIYTRYLTTEDYGVMGLIEMTLDFISIIAGAQLALAIFRFYHKAEKKRDKHAVVSTALTALAISYGLIGAGSYLAADPLAQLIFGTGDASAATLAEYAGLIRIASLALAFQGILIVPLSFCRVTERSGLFVTANLVKLFLALTGNIVFLIVLEMGVEGIFISNLIASAVVGLAMSSWTIRQVGLRFSRAATKDLLRYGIPMIGMQFATFVATFGDRYFLQATWGESEVGLYNLAYQFGFILALLGSLPFEQIWAPKRFEVAQRDDYHHIFSKAFTYSNIWLVTLAVGISLFVSDVFRVMTQPDFFPAADYVEPILVAYVLQAWAGIQDIGILVEERTEYLTLANWIAAIVAVIAYALLIPRYGGYGAALGTVASFGARWAFTYYFSQRLWHVRYEWRPVVRLCTLALLVAGSSLLLPELHILLSVAVHTAFFALWLLFLWNGGILETEEKKQVLALADRGVTYIRQWRDS